MHIGEAKEKDEGIIVQSVSTKQTRWGESSGGVLRDRVLDTRAQHCHYNAVLGSPLTRYCQPGNVSSRLITDKSSLPGSAPRIVRPIRGCRRFAE